MVQPPHARGGKLHAEGAALVHRAVDVQRACPAQPGAQAVVSLLLPAASKHIFRRKLPGVQFDLIGAT